MIKLLLIILLLYTYESNAECKRVPQSEWAARLPYKNDTIDFKEIVENIKAKRKFLCASRSAETGSSEYPESNSNTIIYQRDKWGTIRYDQPSYIIMQK